MLIKENDILYCTKDHTAYVAAIVGNTHARLCELRIKAIGDMPADDGCSFASGGSYKSKEILKDTSLFKEKREDGFAFGHAPTYYKIGIRSMEAGSPCRSYYLDIGLVEVINKARALATEKGEFTPAYERDARGCCKTGTCGKKFDFKTKANGSLTLTYDKPIPAVKKKPATARKKTTKRRPAKARK